VNSTIKIYFLCFSCLSAFIRDRRIESEGYLQQKNASIDTFAKNFKSRRE